MMYIHHTKSQALQCIAAAFGGVCEYVVSEAT